MNVGPVLADAAGAMPVPAAGAGAMPVQAAGAGLMPEAVAAAVPAVPRMRSRSIWPNCGW